MRTHFSVVHGAGTGCRRTGWPAGKSRIGNATGTPWRAMLTVCYRARSATATSCRPPPFSRHGARRVATPAYQCGCNGGYRCRGHRSSRAVATAVGDDGYCLVVGRFVPSAYNPTTAASWLAPGQLAIVPQANHASARIVLVVCVCMVCRR